MGMTTNHMGKDQVKYRMFDWLYYATRLTYNERYSNAEAQQLIQEALATRPQPVRLSHRLLAALGRYLAVVGEWLQTRYDSARQLPLEALPLEE